MHKIINTTDGKYVGKLVDIDNSKIILDNDFIFTIAKIRYNEDMIELSDGEYVIEVILENELKDENGNL